MNNFIFGPKHIRIYGVVAVVLLCLAALQLIIGDQYGAMQSTGFAFVLRGLSTLLIKE